MNRWSSIRSVLVPVTLSLAALHCKDHASTTTASTSEAVKQPDSNDATPPIPSASAAPKEPPPAEWFACTKNEDCVLVNHGRCCAPCDPLNFAGYYTSVNAKFKSEHVAYEGCDKARCPECPPIVNDYPRADSNFFALCQEKRCVAVDLRFSKYSECKSAKDCVWRFGLGCCEGCGDSELVTYNPASSLEHDICPTKPRCPPVTAACRARRHPQQPPECVVNRCQLSD
jgi:hypothetical protein